MWGRFQVNFVGWLFCESPLSIVLFSPCLGCFQCCGGVCERCDPAVRAPFVGHSWPYLMFNSTCVFPWHISQNTFAVYFFSSLNVLTMQGIFLFSFHMSGKNTAWSSFSRGELLVWVLSAFSGSSVRLSIMSAGALSKYKDQTDISLSAQDSEGGRAGWK